MEKKDLLLEKVQSPEKGGYMQRGNAERTPCSLGGPEGEGSPGVQALSLDGGGKAHPVVAQVIDGVVGPEEDVPKDRSWPLRGNWSGKTGIKVPGGFRLFGLPSSHLESPLFSFILELSSVYFSPGSLLQSSHSETSLSC